MTSENYPRVVVLFSHPLVDQAGRPLQALDTEGERQTLWQAFCDSHAPVRVCFDIATTEALQNHLLHEDGCAWLHWSGHGAPGMLVFEDGSGRVHAVRGEQLRQLVATGAGDALELVFVSACHSEEVGQALVEAGVKHVVAVELEQRVLDQAAVTFARGFYRALAIGRTVRQAFEVGRAAVLNEPRLRTQTTREMTKFRLLPEDSTHATPLCVPDRRAQPVDETRPPTSHNLPTRRPDFVGRAWEMHRIVTALLARDRLVTVRGAPGIGKTQTAIEAARWLAKRRHFPSGIHFVELREAAGAETMCAHIATALGAQVESEETLAALLRERECLLVLDNLEDPLRGDRAAVRRLLALVLSRAPRVKILSTSRVLLGAGLPAPERVEAIPELALEESAQLFAENSGERLNTWDLVRNAEFLHIFELLGGHPLSLHIAASHHSARCLSEIREALEQEPDAVLEAADTTEEDEPRLTSVRRSIGLSVRWLEQESPEAIRLFGILSLLPAGASPKALDAIADLDWREPLRKLAQRSLVERDGQGRAGLLPVVLRYAERHLSEEDGLRGNSLATEYFADLFDTAYREFGKRGAAPAVSAAAKEFPNAVACLRRCERGTGRSTYSAQLGFCAANLARLLSRLEEATLLAELSLSVAHTTADRLGEANALRSLGEVLWQHDDLEEARVRYEQALDLYRAIGCRQGEADARRSLGDVSRQRDDVKSAQAHYEAALAICREIGYQRGEADVLDSLGDALQQQDDLERAEACGEQALAIYRGIGHRLGEANMLDSLGDVLRRQDDPRSAQVRYEEALAIYQEIGYRLGEANVLDSLGDALQQQDELQRAQACHEEALTMYREIGSRIGEANALWSLGDVSLRRGDLTAAQAQCQEAQTIYHDIGDRLGEANALKTLADASLHHNEFEQARSRYAEALAIHQEIGGLFGEGEAHDGLGRLKLREGNSEESLVEFGEALTIFREAGIRWNMSDTLLNMVGPLLALGRKDEAWAAVREAEALAREIGDRRLLARAAAVLPDNPVGVL